MATIAPTSEQSARKSKTYTWILGDADEGLGIDSGHFADKTVQFTGTFDSATVKLEGSNDNTNWETLTDPDANNISKTSSAIEIVRENPRYIRPSTSGGAGSAAITVTVFAKGTV